MDGQLLGLVDRVRTQAKGMDVSGHPQFQIPEAAAGEGGQLWSLELLERPSQKSSAKLVPLRASWWEINAHFTPVFQD